LIDPYTGKSRKKPTLLAKKVEDCGGKINSFKEAFKKLKIDDPNSHSLILGQSINQIENFKLSLINRMNPTNNSSQEKKKNGTSSGPNNSNHISKYYPKSTTIPSTFAFLDKTMNTIVTNTFGFKQPVKKTTTNGKHETGIEETVDAHSIAKKVSKPKPEIKKLPAIVIPDESKKTETLIVSDKIENEFENKENFPHENGIGNGNVVGDNGLVGEEVAVTGRGFEKVGINGNADGIGSGSRSGIRNGAESGRKAERKDDVALGEDTIIL
jgi:hypothetical protein